MQRAYIFSGNVDRPYEVLQQGCVDFALRGQLSCCVTDTCQEALTDMPTSEHPRQNQQEQTSRAKLHPPQTQKMLCISLKLPPEGLHVSWACMIPHTQ